jgi:type IX secretion system PorP/SprF family membrane protein
MYYFFNYFSALIRKSTVHKKDNTMKKLVLTLLLAIITTGLFAQQDAKYNLYMFNDMVYNPAVAGSSEGFHTVLLNRNQWIGWGDGQPQTTTGFIHTPFTINKTYEFGTGLVFFQDEQAGGFFKSSGFAVNLTYKRNMFGGKVALGTNLGFMQRSVDGSKFDALDGGDNLIPTGEITGNNFDLGLGTFYKSNDEKIYVGLSMSHVNKPMLKAPGNTSFREPLNRHLYISGGYRYDLANTEIQLRPSLLAKTDFRKTQVDLAALAYYKTRYFGGLAYSSGDGVNLILGADRFINNIGFAYSFNFKGPFAPVNAWQTHEIMLTYDFNIKLPVRPREIIRSPRWL